VEVGGGTPPPESEFNSFSIFSILSYFNNFLKLGGGDGKKTISIEMIIFNIYGREFSGEPPPLR